MTRTKFAPPPSQGAVTFRRILSVPMIVLLATAAMPFTPTAWLFGSMEGAFLIDRLVAGIVLLSALYFQFAVAGRGTPVVMAIPNPLAETETYTAGGKVPIKTTTTSNAEFVFYYHPADYWTYIAAEFGLLAVAQFGPYEFIRRIIVVGVVAVLWAVGWMITPQSRKQWAWGHIKAFWFFIFLDIIRDIGYGGGRRRRR